MADKNDQTTPEDMMKQMADYSPVQLQEVRDAINQRLIIENESETLSQSANQSADTPAQKYEAQHIHNDPVATSSAGDAPQEPADKTAPHDNGATAHEQGEDSNTDNKETQGINKEDDRNLNVMQKRETEKAHAAQKAG